MIPGFTTLVVFMLWVAGNVNITHKITMKPRWIQIWLWGNKAEREAVVSDNKQRSESRRGCLSVCCQSTRCWCRPQLCSRNKQHQDVWLPSVIIRPRKEPNLFVEKISVIRYQNIDIGNILHSLFAFWNVKKRQNITSYVAWWEM